MRERLSVNEALALDAVKGGLGGGGRRHLHRGRGRVRLPRHPVLPHEITQRLNGAVARMLELPDVRARLDRDAIETRVMTPEQFTQFVAQEIGKWGPIAKRVMQGK